MKKISEEELKKIQIGILDTFHKFCCDNGLSYSLAGGTLLGAVRHKGYIPWDDDIDVMMARNDYDKFLSLSENYPYPFKVCSIYSNNDKTKPYTYTYIKIYDTRTNLVEFPDSYHIESAIYIDVFPIDGLPSDARSITKIYDRAKMLKILAYRMSISFYARKTEKRFCLKMIFCLFNIFRLIFKNSISIKLDQFAKRFDIEHSDTIGCIVAGYYTKEAMPKTAFFPIGEIEFEGKKYMSMKTPHIYLTNLYSDYMKLPPVEKRVKSHDNEAYWID